MTDRVEAIRRFSRSCTRHIGLLQESLLHSGMSLPEGRVVWELARRGTATATQLAGDLELDAGYLSRLLRGLNRKGIVTRTPSMEDRRSALIRLTPAGRKAFKGIDEASRRGVATLLEPLSHAEQERLVTALDTARALLSPDHGRSGPAYVLRPPRPGDLGWVVQQY